ncbi:unnamed protein product [Rhizopus stolonifer]
MHTLKLTACQRLYRLTLANCYQLTDVGLCNLIDVQTGIGPELISLDLSDVLNTTDETILKIADSCPRLQVLDLSMSRPHFDISDIERSSIALALNCSYLTEIDLTNCGVTDRTLYAIFRHCRELRDLRLNQCDAAESMLTSRAFINSPLSPNCYEQLRSVDFTGIFSVTDQSLSILIEAAPRIRNLTLNKCNNITDEGVITISKLNKSLYHLHLGHCFQITDRSLMIIAVECDRIRYLDFACCINITDASIVHLAENLPKLRRIGLVKCPNISDVSINALANNSTYIERVHLSYCVNLTVPAIARLLCSCKLVNHLSLTQVPAFLREDYQAFCRTAPLDFNDLQQQTFCVYSGRGVQDIRRHLHSGHLCKCLPRF